MSNVSPVPPGYHTVTPYLTLHDCAAAINFYKTAFEAREKFRHLRGDKIAHAEIVIGNSHLMMSDEWPEMGKLSPKSSTATTSFMVYLPDVGAAFERAVKAGCEIERPVANQPWGDRMGVVKDPFGYSWALATQVELLTDEEIRERLAAAV